MDRIEIERIARSLVDRWGERAAPHAKENVDWADASSDVDSAKDWTSILRSIEVLRDGHNIGENSSARRLES